MLHTIWERLQIKYLYVCEKDIVQNYFVPFGRDDKIGQKAYFIPSQGSYSFLAPTEFSIFMYVQLTGQDELWSGYTIPLSFPVPAFPFTCVLSPYFRRFNSFKPSCTTKIATVIRDKT